jgi:hypothetical protein
LNPDANRILTATGTSATIAQSQSNLTFDGTTLSITSNVRTAAGLVGTPAYSFTTDVSAGMYSTGTNVFGFASAGVNRMLFSNAHVGIGTATPNTGFTVDVSGGITVRRLATATYSNWYMFSDVSASTGSFRFGVGLLGTSTTGNAGGDLIITAYDNSNAVIGTGGQVSIQRSTGNVGIGTISPATRLDVSSAGVVGMTVRSTTASSNIGIQISNAADATVDFGIAGSANLFATGTSANDSAIRSTSAFFLSTYGTTTMCVSGTRVGIGTTAPTVPLDVSSGVNVGVLIRGTAGQSNAGLQFNNGTTTGELGLAGVNGAWSGNSLAGDVVLRAAATQRLILHALGVGGAATFVLSNSNVGVNTIAPRFGFQTNTQTAIPALDVSGQVYGRLPVFVVSGTSLDISANFNAYANSYFYITNSGFTTISNPPTTTTAQGGTFFQFKNATSSYLSITMASTVTITSPVVIPPSNAITLVVSPSNANTFLLF